MEPSKAVWIHNVKLVAQDRVLESGYVRFEAGKITNAGEGEMPDMAMGEAAIDGSGGWLLPGFIDVHVHGGFGSDFICDANSGSLATIAGFHARHGTTVLLPTSVTAAREVIDDFLTAVHAYVSEGEAPGAARIAGVHLEGPYINPDRCGAQNPAFIREPDKGWLEEWHRQYPGLIRIVTLAPEMPGGLELIEWLDGCGIIPSAGHTNATYEQMKAAIGKGLKHAVHTFNAMSGLHHREPGMVGAILDHPEVSCEVIADGQHVHPACIRLLNSVKPHDKLLLITDAIAAAGLHDGAYTLGQLDVQVENGVARLLHDGTLAGSTQTMLGSFRYLVNEVGLDVPSASRISSANPAKLLGLDGAGSIAEGMQADLVLLTSSLDMVQTWVGGHPALQDKLLIQGEGKR